MHHRIYLHIVWTTRERRPVIDHKVARFLKKYLHAVCRQERTRLIAIGLVSDHVHILIRFHPTASIPNIVQRCKGGSSVLANREGHAETQRLRWAKGYSVASVSPGAVQHCIRYIEDQHKRHADRAIAGWSNGRHDSPSAADPPSRGS